MPKGGRGANENGKEWSYKNSWLRYAVLGVLIVALGVLGYMLYDKKMTRRESANTTPEGRGIIRAELPTEEIPLGPGPVGAGAGGAPKPKGKTEPKGKGPTMDEAKGALAGRWESKRENELHSVEYKPDGTFTYVVEKDGKPATPITGQWKLTRIEMGAAAQPVAALQMEWSVEGKPAISDVIQLRSPVSGEHHFWMRH